MFGLGAPLPVHSLRAVQAVGAVMLPVITRLPFRWFYDLGDDQLAEPDMKFGKYYERHDIIAVAFCRSAHTCHRT